MILRSVVSQWLNVFKNEEVRRFTSAAPRASHGADSATDIDIVLSLM